MQPEKTKTYIIVGRRVLLPDRQAPVIWTDFSALSSALFRRSDARTLAVDVVVRIEGHCDLLCIYKRTHAYELKFFEGSTSVLFHRSESAFKIDLLPY